MANLDGTEKPVPTPYDAHEQATRGSSAPAAEYPKAVDHVDNPYGYGKEPVVVNSAEEEAAYNAAKENA